MDIVNTMEETPTITIIASVTCPTDVHLSAGVLLPAAPDLATNIADYTVLRIAMRDLPIRVSRPRGMRSAQ
jgi:hypothetical protein